MVGPLRILISKIYFLNIIACGIKERYIIISCITEFEVGVTTLSFIPHSPSQPAGKPSSGPAAMVRPQTKGIVKLPSTARVPLVSAFLHCR